MQKLIMYSILLHSHNGLRILIVVMALVTFFYLWKGYVTGSIWKKAGRTFTVIYTGLLDLQVLLGFLLYFVYSPITKAAFHDFGAAMKNSDLRFYSVEHIGIMLASVVFAHIAGKFAKKDIPDKRKWQATTLWITLSIITLALGIPWSRAWM